MRCRSLKFLAVGWKAALVLLQPARSGLENLTGRHFRQIPIFSSSFAAISAARRRWRGVRAGDACVSLVWGVSRSANL
jgi:hypothetical protein